MKERLSLLQVEPGYRAPLDAGFSPCILGKRRYEQEMRRSGNGRHIVVGVERERGLVCRWEADLLPAGQHDEDTWTYVERIIKFLLWSRGGWRIFFAGPDDLGQRLKAAYAPGGLRAFDADLMSRAYERVFEVQVVRAEEVPSECESALALGGHLEGCRIGFDLGASDYKVSAVIDGEVVYADELPWDPKEQPDPQYHFSHIEAAIRKAASHMPRLDAIGGSSAGVIVDNSCKVASLFRSVPAERFEREVKPLFSRLQDVFKVPLKVVNDGDVTALAGALSLGINALMGIAMGSSQAGGYIGRDGKILGWLNELAFAPVDFNPEAAIDEWSGDYGVGALYFSQQAVGKLASAAGFCFPDALGLPDRLKEIQGLATEGNREALKIYETIGVYLGYTIPWYAEFYDLSHLLILGRVTSGAGGDRLLAQAKLVLEHEFPSLAEAVSIHVPDEVSRRVGQAVAAASLPGPR